MVFILGCSSFGGDGLSKQTTAAKFSKGVFNSTILINGAEKTELTLTNRQPAEIGLFVKNQGPNDINNVNIRAIGCVDIDSSQSTKSVVQKGTTDYFSWSIRAPELGTSESFSCPLILRACFEETSNGYMELVVVNETYSEAPSTPNFYYKSGIFTIEPNFGAFRIINDLKSDPDVLYGTLKIKNTGSGWIDYLNQTEESDLEINKIKKINMTIDSSSALEFYKIGDISKASGSAIYSYVTTGSAQSSHCDSDMGDGYETTINGHSAYCRYVRDCTDGKFYECWHDSAWQKLYVISLDGKKLNLASGALDIGSSDYNYFLSLIGGQELSIYLGIFAPQYPAKDISYDMVDYTIESGYCIDLASLNVHLTGR
ncbi:MAG: hypothetical protein PHC66_01675 [Candidatus Nanoarchaeia archaeon]|nr:hypothetical protein [Candidatus Nanoarchaeia archaeon]MDD5238921.1 hypothetical protein [Candidatus Nanoarchaeia archaeon]